MCGTRFHLDVETGFHFFMKIPEREVAEEMIVRAEIVRAFVCGDLRIDSRIVWIRPASPSSKREPRKEASDEELDDFVRLKKDTTGGFTPWNFFLREIWILSQPKEFPHLEGTIAHELRHAWQKQNIPDVFKNDEAQSEADAYAYSYEVLRRYLASSGRLTDELKWEIDKQETDTKRWFNGMYPDGEYKILNVRSH